MDLLRKCFFAGLTLLSSVNLLAVTPLRFISMTNPESKVKQQITNVNRDESVFYPFSIKSSKCIGSCNNINDPNAKIYVPDVVKNLNVKVFNLMLEWHETYKCKFGLDASVCNNKQRCDVDECKCECKVLTDKGVCDKGSICNPSHCKCDCDKSCDVGEHLDYENCKCKKKCVDKLVDECTENIYEAKIAGENEHKNKCTSCTLYIVLF